MKKANEVIELKGLQIEAGKLVVTTKAPKVTPKAPTKVTKKASRNIYGIQLSSKPNLELRTAMKVIKDNSEKKNMTFQFLFSEFKKGIIQSGKNNLKQAFYF